MAAIDLNPGVRRGLRARIVLLTMAGTLGAIVILGWLSWSTVQALGKQVLEERKQLAVSVAVNIDSAINSELALLERISPASGATGPRVDQAALREAYVRSHFLMRDFLLDRSGKVIQSEPAGSSDDGPPAGLSALSEAIKKGAPEVSALTEMPGGAHRLFLFVPLRNAKSQVIGVIAGEIDPASPAFRGLLDFVPLAARETVDLVDQRGVVLASTEPDRLFTERQ